MAKRDLTPHQQSLIARIKRARPSGKRRLRRPPKPVQPLSIERWYVKQLQRMVDVAHERVKEKLIPKLSHYSAQAPHHFKAVKNDDLMSEIYGEVAEIRVFYAKTVSPQSIKSVIEQAAGMVDGLNKSNLQNQIAAVLGVDIFLNDGKLVDTLDRFVTKNVKLINSVGDRYFEDLNQTLYDGFAEGIRWEEIAEDIQDRYDVSQWNAERIARDQVNKLNGELSMNRQKEVGVETYTWRTSMDERVRDEHRDREDKDYAWPDQEIEYDGPKGEASDIIPGSEILCRCWAEPVLDDLI